MISISWVILTFNRRATVEASVRANLETAGYPITEVIHVDNGSTDDTADWFWHNIKPTVQIRNRENQGVAKGYNRGLALTTCSHIVITGCDRIMPKNWLANWVHCYRVLPMVGGISIYTENPGEDKSMRIRGPAQEINGITFVPSVICEARIHTREFLLGAGFFREDFGLYGYEDVEWADRAEAYAYRNNLINFVVPAFGSAVHLNDENKGNYHAMKIMEGADERKSRLVRKCHAEGSPYYNPYYQIERNRLNEE